LQANAAAGCAKWRSKYRLPDQCASGCEEGDAKYAACGTPMKLTRRVVRISNYPASNSSLARDQSQQSLAKA
jgi:hypothetical protein